MRLYEPEGEGHSDFIHKFIRPTIPWS